MAEPMISMNEPHPEAQNRANANFLELFFGVLFEPVITFRQIAALDKPNTPLLFNAVLAVILVSAIAPLVQLAQTGGNPGVLVLGIPLSVISGLIIWALTGLIISLLGYAFTGQNRIAVFLVLSGLATLPWLLIGPVSLLKFGIGLAGSVISVLLALGIWLWSVLLFALAVTATYRMTIERTLIVLAAPFVGLLVFLAWFVGFIGNIAQFRLT